MTMNTVQEPRFEVRVSARIDAPAGEIYTLIADYRNGHPRILPKQFSGLVVEAGGIGAGTAIHFQMKVLGRRETYRALVAEPEPGRVLTERYQGENAPVTSFTVDPASDGRSADVTISTELPVRSGSLGRIESFLTTRLLRPIYVRELELLAAWARDRRLKLHPPEPAAPVHPVSDEPHQKRVGDRI